MRAPLASHGAVTGRRAWLASRSGGARLHAGVDLAARRGVDVVAPESGTIVASMWNGTERSTDLARPWNGYGPGVVVLRGASGVWHVLSHVEAPRHVGAVSEGERVATVSGQRHVHWEVRTIHPWVPSRDGALVEVSLDPLAWLRGERRSYDDAGSPSPDRPVASHLTPRVHRPGAARPTIPPPAPVGAKGENNNGCS